MLAIGLDPAAGWIQSAWPSLARASRVILYYLSIEVIAEHLSSHDTTGCGAPRDLLSPTPGYHKSEKSAVFRSSPPSPPPPQQERRQFHAK
jgi:hypothetical protein